MIVNPASAATKAASEQQVNQAQAFISNQIKGIGLVDSYQEDGKAISYVYDNALAAIACMSMDNYGLAKKILNALSKKAQQSEFGVPYESYNYNSGKAMSYDVYAGNIAWLLQAFNIYQKSRSSPDYYKFQKKLADYLVSLQDSRDGGIRETRYSSSGKRTEHNLIAYAALKNFGKLNDKSSYSSKADDIMTFLIGSSVWDGERFNRGKNDTAKVTTAQALGALLMGSGYSSALTYAEKYLKLTDYYNSEAVTGFDFNGDLDTVWLEGSLQMALAFYKSGDITNGDYYYDEAAKTIQSDGAVLLATSKGSASEWWTMEVWRAIAPTSWLIMYYNKFSPLTLFGVKAKDNAGNESAGETSDGITALSESATDTTAPTKPTVTDKGKFTAEKNKLSVSWVSEDKESGIAEYQYRITIDSSSGTTVKDWTSAGTDNSVTVKSLDLTNGKTYYFSVKAKNGSGLWSEAGCSDGIMVDSKNPSIKDKTQSLQDDAKSLLFQAKVLDEHSGVKSVKLKVREPGIAYSEPGDWKYYDMKYSTAKGLYRVRIAPPKSVPIMEYYIIAKDNASNQKETEKFWIKSDDF